jgi:hypothetical protein
MATSERLPETHPAFGTMTAANESAPARPSGSLWTARLAERYTIPGTLAVCATRRSFLRFWKTSGVPFQVQDIGLGGLSFRHVGFEMKPGTLVRLNILLPKCSPIRVKGIVVSNRDDIAQDAGASMQFSRICGVKFVDYDAEAWAVLGGLPRFSGGVPDCSFPPRAAAVERSLAPGPTVAGAALGRTAH